MSHIALNRRYVPVAEFQRISGLSYKTVMHMIRTSQLPHVVTESGQYRVDTQPNGQSNAILAEKIDDMQKYLKALCKQFNTAI